MAEDNDIFVGVNKYTRPEDTNQCNGCDMTSRVAGGSPAEDNYR